MKKFFICVIAMLCLVSPIQANDTKQILVISKDLPQVFILTPKENNTYDVSIFPKDLNLKLTCMDDKITPISNFKLNDNGISCLTSSLNSNYHLNIENYIKLDMKKIAADFNIDLKRKNLNRFPVVIDTFHEISQHITFSNIINFNSYIDTDFGLSDIYDFYKSYQSGDPDMTYYYPHIVYLPSYQQYISLDRKLYLQE